MIDVRIFQTKTSEAESNNGELLKRFNFVLEKSKFYGKIELSYQAGKLIHVATHETFTPETLVNLVVKSL